MLRGTGVDYWSHVLKEGDCNLRSLVMKVAMRKNLDGDDVLSLMALKRLLPFIT